MVALTLNVWLAVAQLVVGEGMAVTHSTVAMRML